MTRAADPDDYSGPGRPHHGALGTNYEQRLLVAGKLGFERSRELEVSISPSGLPAGTYSASLYVTALGSTGPSLVVPVTLTVGPLPQLTASPCAGVRLHAGRFSAWRRRASRWRAAAPR